MFRGIVSRPGKKRAPALTSRLGSDHNLGMARSIAPFVLLALVAGTISNLTAGKTRVLAWVGSHQASTPTVEPPPPVEIGTAEAFVEHGRGTLFIDARASDVYAQGHVPGARSIPVWEAQADKLVLELMMQIPPPGPRMVVYCQGGHCDDSHMLRQKLLGAGYKDVLIDRQGFPGWVEAGHPVEK